MTKVVFLSLLVSLGLAEIDYTLNVPVNSSLETNSTISDRDYENFLNEFHLIDVFGEIDNE